MLTLNRVVYVLFLLVLVGIYACSDNSGNANQEVKQDTQSEQKDTTTCTVETVKDPNNPKAMALNMRQMADNMQRIKELIEKGEKPDSVKFPFIRFYLSEPTDPEVLEPLFFENSRLFQRSYTTLFRHPAEQKKYFNLVVGSCINCHQHYCNGPIKRIRKLYIE